MGAHEFSVQRLSRFKMECEEDFSFSKINVPIPFLKESNFSDLNLNLFRLLDIMAKKSGASAANCKRRLSRAFHVVVLRLGIGSV